jgi:hypothetical protein
MRSGLLSVVVCAVIACSMPAMAQVPSAEQLELLRSLSPEDREALMEQLGISGSGLDDSTETGTGTGPGPGPGGSTDRRSRDGREENGDSRDKGMRGEDLQRDESLKARDTVLLEIDFKKDKPPRVLSQGADLPALTIPGEPAPVLEPEEKDKLQDLIDLVRSRRVSMRNKQRCASRP